MLDARLLESSSIREAIDAHRAPLLCMSLKADKGKLHRILVQAANWENTKGKANASLQSFKESPRADSPSSNPSASPQSTVRRSPVDSSTEADVPSEQELGLDSESEALGEDGLCGRDSEGKMGIEGDMERLAISWSAMDLIADSDMLGNYRSSRLAEGTRCLDPPSSGNHLSTGRPSSR